MLLINAERRLKMAIGRTKVHMQLMEREPSRPLLLRCKATDEKDNFTLPDAEKIIACLENLRRSKK